MKILPVIDLSRGQAVHAVAGDRASYQPVKSVLAPSADPLDLARAYRDKLGLREIYLADLDSIAGREPQWEVYRALLREDLTLMVDAGVRDRHLALGLKEWGVRSVVAGLETLEGPERIPELVEALGQRSFVLGLDLRNGSPLGDSKVWGSRDAAAIARAAFAKGVTRFLVLDLARVGTGAGPPLEAARAVEKPLRAVDLLVGGGIRSVDDLRALALAGVRGALLASALHSGSIDRAAVEEAARLG
jgi:phosphoribosylformimino-5-aminoimidazole carboxamide ribotide isomerase